MSTSYDDNRYAMSSSLDMTRLNTVIIYIYIYIYIYNLSDLPPDQI